VRPFTNHEYNYDEMKGKVNDETFTDHVVDAVDDDERFDLPNLEPENLFMLIDILFEKLQHLCPNLFRLVNSTAREI